MRYEIKKLASSITGLALLSGVAVTGLAVTALTGPAATVAQASESIIKISRAGPGVSKRVKLGLNKAIVVDLPTDAHDILVADPSMADAVTRTSRRIYLFGKTVGQTNIFVFGPNGEEIVAIELEIERDVAGLEGYLERFIPDSDITVEIISDNIVLTGYVRTPQDAAQAARLAEIFLAGGEATTRNITATSEGGDAAIFAEARQKSKIVNMLKIDGEDQVTLKVTIAEVSRQVLKQLGFNSTVGNGPNQLTSSTVPFLQVPGLSQAAQLAGSINGVNVAANINALERAGVIRTLAEPSLTAISGEIATFNVGGEFNVETERGEEGTIFEKIEYGIKLEFLPVVLSPGRISLRVVTEVSEPTFEGQSPLPSIQRRQASTSVELPSGGSMVLAGLVRDTYRQQIAGMPGVSKLPVIGTLFRSKEFMRNETELVIIATPYLVKPVARNALARPDDNFNPSSDGAGFFLGRVNRAFGRMETDLPPGRYHGVVGFIYK